MIFVLPQEAELQEEIDKTLYEVRKKKQEASQTLDLIKGLKKLRQLRKGAAQVKGQFANCIDPLGIMLQVQRELSKFQREDKKKHQAGNSQSLSYSHWFNIYDYEVGLREYRVYSTTQGTIS